MENNNRYLDSLAPIFSQAEEADCLILKSPSDMGVRRNKGRNGARYAPASIENIFQKFNNHLSIKGILSQEVSDQKLEEENYEKAMERSRELIKSLINDHPKKKNSCSPIFHLGGGHDHALPLLRALEAEKRNILIINFDAHCDTRVDTKSHSGTPFRDFDTCSKVPFHLVQVGIHSHANSKKTLAPLKRNSMEIVFSHEIEERFEPEKFIDLVFDTCPFSINEETSLFISLDCDAIDSSLMSAVSAVNHNGLPPKNIARWVDTLKDFPCGRKVFGIYEYNPLYEDLSQKGARFLAGLMYRFLT